MVDDKLYMQRAFELATLGLGKVNPNPMVGCVIVYQDKIIGEGWHEQHGKAHAEIQALNKVKDKKNLLESTLYVTLEPCSHHGNTPPCADRIITEKIKRVVIANKDSNPLVSGRGIERMRAAGITVDVGLMEEEGRWLNRRFFTYFEQKRPYVILKWAETADGFIARENFDSKWISNGQSRKLVHKWRSQEDSIMVGTNTALYDNPRLNVREWEGKDPIRLVIDKHLRLPADLNLFDKTQPTICYNLVKNGTEDNLEFVQVVSENVFSFMLNDLYQRNILSVLIEGGSKLLQHIIDAGLWDESRVFQSPQIFENGIAAPDLSGLEAYQKVSSGEDKLITYHNQNIKVLH